MTQRSRDKKLTLRASEMERSEIREKAKQSNMSLQDYLLSCAMNKKVKETPPIEYYELINKVNELCVVMKQLVSHMRLNEVVETKDIQRCKTRMEELMIDLDMQVKVN